MDAHKSIGNGMKWGLGLSLLVNLFLVAAVGAMLRNFNHFSHRFHHPMPSDVAWTSAQQQLSPQTQARLKEVVKGAAIKGEVDMDQSRIVRQRMIDAAGSEPYDTARIEALAEQARTLEDQPRARIENALIEDMADMPVKERQAVARFILQHGFIYQRIIGRDGHKRAVAPPPPDLPAGSASASAAGK
jgi:uncharacterized membrane protein